MKPKFPAKIYFPGLISLVFLPLVLVGYYAYQSLQPRLALMDVHWNSEESIREWNRNTFGYPKIDISAFKNFTPLILNGNSGNDNITIAKLKALCQGLIKDKDKAGGVTVTMGAAANYKNLVDVFDATYPLGHVISIVPYGDNIYFYLPKTKGGYASPEENGQWPFICGYALHNNVTGSVNIEDDYLSKLKPFWPSFIPFAMMIFFAMKNKRKLSAA